ncbi:MAG: hypothetical protein QOG82_2764 [Actinomycetota bacterium]|jgi:hypothetical protein|nr:hypothetical protein [Actinomycetota bacterium]
MEILEASDLTHCPEAAGRLAACDAETVKHHVTRHRLRSGRCSMYSVWSALLLGTMADFEEDWPSEPDGAGSAEVSHM